MDKPPWDQDKILKLSISTDLDLNLKKLRFSQHLLRGGDGERRLRVKVPYNYYFLDFKSKSIELLVT